MTPSVRGEEEPTLPSISDDFTDDCWKTLGDKRTEDAIVVVAGTNCGEATYQSQETR